MVPQGYIRGFVGIGYLKKQLPKTKSKYKIIPLNRAAMEYISKDQHSPKNKNDICRVPKLL
jgi:hypothetical protein